MSCCHGVCFQVPVKEKLENGRNLQLNSSHTKSLGQQVPAVAPYGPIFVGWANFQIFDIFYKYF